MKLLFENARCLIVCLALSSLSSPLILAQDAVTDGSPRQSQELFQPAASFSEVGNLERRMRDGGRKEGEEAARRLIELAQSHIQNDDVRAGISIAHNLFLSSAPAQVRRQAFGVLFEHAPELLKPHTREIRLLVPNVSCYGRFQDSLKKHICDKVDWAYTVTARDTHDVREGSTLPTVGTVAELTFVVDKDKKPRNLLVALHTSKQYEMDGWTVWVERPIDELLEAEAPAADGNLQPLEHLKRLLFK